MRREKNIKRYKNNPTMNAIRTKEAESLLYI